MIFSDAVRGYYFHLSVDNQHSPVTAEDYKAKLERICKAWNDPPVENITREMIQEYLVAVKSRSSMSTVKFYHRVLRGFFIWAEKEHICQRPDVDIPVPVSPPPEIIPYTHDELERMSRRCVTLRQKAIFHLLLDTGMRNSELCRATIGDTDIITGKITIRPYTTGTKSRKREVYFEDHTRNALWKYLTTRTNKDLDDPLISRVDGTFMNRNNLFDIIERLGYKSKVLDATVQRFRHTFAVEFLRNGGDVFSLKRLLGHSQLHTVQMYVNLAQADVQKAHKRASPVENLRL